MPRGRGVQPCPFGFRQKKSVRQSIAELRFACDLTAVQQPDREIGRGGGDRKSVPIPTSLVFSLSCWNAHLVNWGQTEDKRDSFWGTVRTCYPNVSSACRAELERASCGNYVRPSGCPLREISLASWFLLFCKSGSYACQQRSRNTRAERIPPCVVVFKKVTGVVGTEFGVANIVSRSNWQTGLTRS